ncbi:MAG: hypothetical protein V5A27_04160, partial [Halapricum sp.]
ITVRASEDPRIGLAAVVLLAATPAHGFRTSLGFADHHAFDYLWLALTVYALIIILAEADRARFALGPIALLGVGIGGQLLAWDAGPLLLVPLAVSIPVIGMGVVDSDRSDPEPLISITAGVGFGAVLTLLAHYALGWHTTSVVVVAVTLVAGSLGVLALTWTCRRLGRSWQTLSILYLFALGIGFVLLSSLFPEILDGLSGGIERLLRDTRIGEMSSLIEDYGVVLGPLILLGFAPFLALPAVVVALRDTWRTGNLAWPVVTVYACYFAVLSVTQRRFGGELAPFLAVLGGLGMLGLLGWLDIVRRPPQLGGPDGPPEPPVKVPDRTRLALLGGIVGMFTGTGTLYTTLINARVTIDKEAVRAAQWMQEYALDRGWTYPNNFVLSEWGRNRMFNYIVNGQSASYAYAQRYYEDFLFTSDAQRWYDQFVDRVGFVVVRDFDHIDTTNPFLMYTRLLRFGSAGKRSPGLGHYRAVYASPDREYVVFTLVPGATVSGTVERTTEISTDVSISGAEFEYSRRIDPDEDGSFTVTVAHPGIYRLGERTVEVTEHAVQNGTVVEEG